MAPIVSDLAAIVVPGDMDHGDAADALLADFCRGLQGLGWRVGGLAQRRLPAEGGGKPRMQLVDLRTGQVFSISQDLGPLSRACSLDPGGVARASGVLRQALADRVQLVVTNRFGELESTGGGFAAEMAALADAGIPVLTVVAHRHLEAWRRFTGGMGYELPTRLSALQAWFTLAAGRAAPAGAA
ncbi:MAG: DUF2478 domain-containing protein [Diaphorobacter nitroreducens]|uniref:DUF2478 domain-containing protein n=1 Tax=Diaphorobacter nitroreducens TaxID=164759 RepID=UPI003C70EB80